MQAVNIEIFINYLVVTYLMSKKNPSGQYKIELGLADGVNLEMLIFGPSEHRWIFYKRFVSPENRRLSKDLILVNETTLTVNYDDGLAQKCNLVMNITRQDRKGKSYFLGVDISDGAHLFAEFIYEKQGNLFRMKAIDLGSHGKIDVNSLGQGLVRTPDFPFPLKDRIENESGVYRVPFLKRIGEEAFFEFPENYRL